MENYQGDLTDILRPSSSFSSSCWEFDQPPPITATYSTSSSPLIGEGGVDFFGDLFCNIRNPFLNELDLSTSSYFEDSARSGNITTAIKAHESSCNNTNMFSKIQISRPPPNNKSPVLPPPPPPKKSPLMAAMASPSGMVPSDRIINVNSSKSCLIDNSSRPVQISSPRNLGIKRRKSQAKKVVCIPAPAALNSRPSGEVVPSDLWAWRKYGQKPIKGSPYPRGYYRCSSLKGCPARKQVERSRTDPNMLVITYTSEHNHPWPTQRNALAGSTRTQPLKNSIVGSKGESSNDEAAIGGGGSSSGGPVKEEMDLENEMVDEGSSYRPAIPDHDFFADLGEIDCDPLELLFSSSPSSQGFGNGEKQVNKEGGLDPFGLFDWSSVDSRSPAPFGGANRGL